MCSFPFDLIYPTIALTVVYWLTDLGEQSFDEFMKMVLIVNATYFMSASYGLLYSTIIPKLETAMALVPVLVIPFMLLGGFFINLDGVTDLRVIFYPFIYLSPFKYGYQAAMLAINPQLDPDFKPVGLYDNIWVLLGIGLGVRVLSLIAMQIVSSPKRPNLKKPE